MFIKVNGVNIFYEECGEGEPIILLHGNSEDHTIFDKFMERLKPKYKVYAIDTRCHGQSEKTKELSYELIARDVKAFITELKIEKPMVYGFSDGGIVGILLAVRYPGLISKLMVSGVNVNPKGLKDKIMFWYKVGYFFTRSKKLRMMIKEPNITKKELESIRIPVLMTTSDKDVVKKEHADYIADCIYDCKTILIIGATHSDYIVHSGDVYDIVKDFLE